MGYRFRRSKTILPGVKVSTTGKSTSISFGGKAGRITFNSKGKVTNTVRIPGTGISHVSTTSISGSKNKRATNSSPQKKFSPTKNMETNRSSAEWRTALQAAQIRAMDKYREKHLVQVFLILGIVMIVCARVFTGVFLVAAIASFVYSEIIWRRQKKINKAFGDANNGGCLPPINEFPWLNLQEIVEEAKKESEIKPDVLPSEDAQLKEMWIYLKRHDPNITLCAGLLLLYGVIPAILLASGPDSDITSAMALGLSMSSLLSFVLIGLSFKFRSNCKQTRSAAVDFYTGGCLVSFQSMPWLNIERIDVKEPETVKEPEPVEVEHGPEIKNEAEDITPQVEIEPAGYSEFIKAYDAYSHIYEVGERIKAAQVVLANMEGLDVDIVQQKILSESTAEYGGYQHPVLGLFFDKENILPKIHSRVDERYHKDIYIIEKANLFASELDALPRCDIRRTESQLKPMDTDSMPEIRYTGVGPAFNRERLPSFVVIDTETTGLDAEEDTILELSAIRYENFKPVEAFTTLINPGVHISKRITELNGITDEMVADAPTLAQIAPDFIAFVGQEPLAGYNVSFDLRFLYAAGIDLVTKKRKIFDVLKLCRKTYSLEHFKLADVTEYLEIYRYDAHRSLSDCLATGKVFDRVIEDIKNL